MEFYDIENTKITCSKCGTSVIVPLNAKNLHYAKEKEYRFQCPNCGDDLTELMTAARKSAIQYNEVCRSLKELEAQGCNFADIEGF